MNPPDTSSLLSDCHTGDEQAVAEFIEAYRPDVFRMALSILDDPAEADEAAQDTLLRALKNLHKYRGEGKVTTWLYTITLNVCRGRLRKRRSRQRLSQVLSGVFRMNAHVPNHIEEQAIRNESEARTWKAIGSLPDNLRIVVTLRYYQALPISEIAAILRISERAVHYRLRTAHETLRPSLEERSE